MGLLASPGLVTRQSRADVLVISQTPVRSPEACVPGAQGCSAKVCSAARLPATREAPASSPGFSSRGGGGRGGRRTRGSHTQRAGSTGAHSSSGCRSRPGTGSSPLGSRGHASTGRLAGLGGADLRPAQQNHAGDTADGPLARERAAARGRGGVLDAAHGSAGVWSESEGSGAGLRGLGRGWGGAAGLLPGLSWQHAAVCAAIADFTSPPGVP